jgi:hypothetical protein
LRYTTGSPERGVTRHPIEQARRECTQCYASARRSRPPGCPTWARRYRRLDRRHYGGLLAWAGYHAEFYDLREGAIPDWPK